MDGVVVTRHLTYPRLLVNMGYRNDISASRYLRGAGNTDMTATRGYTIVRAGWVVGAACHLTVSAHTTNGTLDFEVHVNGSSVYAITSPTITAGGTYQFQGTQLRGIDSFSAGDIVAGFVRYDGSLVTTLGSNCAVMALVEVEFTS